MVTAERMTATRYSLSPRHRALLTSRETYEHSVSNSCVQRKGNDFSGFVFRREACLVEFAILLQLLSKTEREGQKEEHVSLLHVRRIGFCNLYYMDVELGFKHGSG
jgi:hypothetical protein